MAASMLNRKLFYWLFPKRCITYSFCRLKSCATKFSVKDALQLKLESNKKPIFVEGWLKSLRKQKRVTFFHVNDGSCSSNLQVVADPDVCGNLTYGSSVRVEGELVTSPGQSQSLELKASSIQVYGTCDVKEYPFQPKGDYSLDYIRGYPHVRVRTEHHSQLLRLRSAATMAVHKYFQENGYAFIHTPIITSNDCEGAGEVFHVQGSQQSSVKKDTNTSGDTDSDCATFFGHPAYLTVSGQLHLEAITGAFSKAYNFGPTFRAENSFSRHHLCEFYMIEAELAFIQHLEDLFQVMETLVCEVTKTVMASCAEEMEFFQKAASEDHRNILSNLMKNRFERMTYTDAVKLLEGNNEKFKFKVSWGSDLQKEHEKFLVKHCDNIPVFVYNFPADLKPFYARQNSDGVTVAAVDLLVPGVGELFGGSLREERYDVLRASMDKAGLTKNYEWYLDLRRFGSVPHGGFGMGFERYLQCLLGISNIKDTLPFPRWSQHCSL